MSNQRSSLVPQHIEYGGALPVVAEDIEVVKPPYKLG
jgi:hypothetical protein